MSLFAELRRRNVFKVGAAYLALGWVVVQITATLAPAFHLPESALPLVTWIGVAAFPFVLIFAWVYEITPEGLKRESEVDRSESITHITSKRLDYVTIGMLAVAIGLFLLQYLHPHASEAPATAEAVATPATSPAVPTESPASPQPAAAIAPDDKSIAVLPFVNMSSDKEQEYFSDGISEELLNLLAQIPELKVIARTSSFSYKGKDVKVEQIGQELHVAHVLEGSVRKSGNTLRITTQLVRTSDSSHLWSDTYDRPLDDIFAVQDEIAGAVVEQLKIELLDAAPKAKVVDPQAYALYLQGRQLAHQQGGAKGWTQAEALYQQALAIDPDYAAVWQGLGWVYSREGNNGVRPIAEAARLAREAVNKALTLDPDFAPTHAVLGYIAMSYDRDLSTAARHYTHALTLAPDDPEILRSAATLARNIGRLDTAIVILGAVIARDPLNALAHLNVGEIHLIAGRPDAALASFRVALALSPGLAIHYNIGVALLQKGEPQAALAAMQQESEDPWRAIGLPMVWHALGEQARSDDALAEVIRDYEKDWAYNIAYVYAYRNEADRAFEWLDKAVAYQDPGLASINLEPLFANTHSDPRWLPFLRKIGYAPEQLAAIKFDVKLPQQ